MATESAATQAVDGPVSSSETYARQMGEYDNYRLMIEHSSEACTHKVRLDGLPQKEAGAILIAKLLEMLGEDPNRNGLVETPRRVWRALKEMTAGYAEEPEDILSKVFEEAYDEIVVVKDIPFTSMCEHHLLPFTGTADIGYLPGKVVGLSKLARLVDCFSRRFQIQERLTKQIAESIEKHLEAKGVAVVVRAGHSCLACRGVRKPGVEMVTSAMLGVFRTTPEARAEFLALCSK